MIKYKEYHIYFILTIFSIFAFFYNNTIPLHIDESYYWVWSTKLQGGYYDHPPMIAYLIKLSTSIFGTSEAGIRFSTVFCMSAAAWFVYKLTLELTKSIDTSIFASTIFITLPLTQMGYIITTPDSPLTLFWAGSLYYTYKAINEKTTSTFILAGIFIGLMMFSKYTSALFLGALFLYLLIFDRKVFFSKKFYLAIILALIIISPMLYWNYSNDWISFSFQYNHGTAETLKLNLDDFFEFLGGNFIIFTPIFMSILIISQFKGKLFIKDKKLFFINLFFLVPFLFFMYKGLFKKMELNWIAPAYIAATIITTVYIANNFKTKKWIYIGIVFSLLLTSLIRFPDLFNLPKNANIQNRVFGYKEAALYINKIKTNEDKIYADHLTRASILKYYLDENPDVYIPTQTRFSQYDMWETIDKKDLKDGIYFSKFDKSNELKNIFKNVTLIKRFEAKKEGLKTKIFYIFRVSN